MGEHFPLGSLLVLFQEGPFLGAGVSRGARAQCEPELREEEQARARAAPQQRPGPAGAAPARLLCPPCCLLQSPLLSPAVPRCLLQSPLLSAAVPASARAPWPPEGSEDGAEAISPRRCGAALTGQGLPHPSGIAFVPRS